MSELALALLRDLDPPDLAAVSDDQAAALALAQRLAPFRQPQGKDAWLTATPVVRRSWRASPRWERNRDRVCE